jgi:hypothetical protein
VAADGSVKVKRTHSIQGGTLFGLIAAPHESITFTEDASTRAISTAMRVDEVPVVETHLIKNAEATARAQSACTETDIQFAHAALAAAKQEGCSWRCARYVALAVIINPAWELLIPRRCWACSR